jgi:aspartate dehydrogenase
MATPSTRSRKARESLRIGLIGYGSIGIPVAEAVVEGQVPGGVLAGILRARPEAGGTPAGVPVVASIHELLATGPDVVVEVGGHPALRAYGPAVLASGCDLMTISVGALADDGLLVALQGAAESTGARMLVPSGAIAGLDMLNAGQVGGLEEVRHTVRKPPAALLPADEAARVVASGQPRVLYEGPAREAVGRFPENVNVVAAVSLSGIGLDRTIARVVADPGVTHNTHEVEASGTFGTLRVEVRNVPGPNPKTGRIVGPSVIRALQRLRASMVLGA